MLSVREAAVANQLEVGGATAHFCICPRQRRASAGVRVQRLVAEHNHTLGIILCCRQLRLQIKCNPCHPMLVCRNDPLHVGI